MNMPKAYKWAYVVLTVLSSAFLLLTIYSSFGKTEIFQSKLIIVLFAIYFAVQIAGFFIMEIKMNIRTVGFFLLHIGILVMLTGMFVYYLVGDFFNDVHMRTSENGIVKYNYITSIDKDGNEKFIDPGFEIRVDDFKIDYYEDTHETKQYITNISFIDRSSLKAETKELKMNHPVYYNGWKIYFMGADSDYIGLMLKKDPAENVTLAGIYMTLAGAVIMCLIAPRKRRKEQVDFER